MCVFQKQCQRQRDRARKVEIEAKKDFSCSHGLRHPFTCILIAVKMFCASAQSIKQTAHGHGYFPPSQCLFHFSLTRLHNGPVNIDHNSNKSKT